MAPVAKVESRIGHRTGRGFSTLELKKAGLTIRVARKLKVPVDARRKTAYDANIKELAKLKLPEQKPKAKKPAKVTKPKKAAKPPAAKPKKKAKAKPRKPAPKKPVKKKSAEKKK